MHQPRSELVLTLGHCIIRHGSPDQQNKSGNKRVHTSTDRVLLLRKNEQIGDLEQSYF
jgi:hypothetical protein